MTAITSSRWTNPPTVYELIMPSTHQKNHGIVQSMTLSPEVVCCNRGTRPTLHRIRDVGGLDESP